VAVTASNAGGATTRASDPTAAVVSAGPANATPPAISGTERDGSTLTADDGTWTGTTPMTYAYRWQRCAADGSGCVDIRGATTDRYTLTADDVGHTIHVVVTAANAEGSGSATATSGPIAAAATVPSPTTPGPVPGPTAPGPAPA